MRFRLILSIFIGILFANCQNKNQAAKTIEIIPNLVKDFERELNTLNSKEIKSIDQATVLFQKYVKKTNNLNQKDSLFQPYFNYYNFGRELLLNEEIEVIEQYGFTKQNNNGNAYLVPTKSEYLQNNIIRHLSAPMTQFCNQQLKEFGDVANLETIAENAIWWEQFNKNNPDFFMKEMTAYHYKNWHLKNLLSGIGAATVFNKQNDLTPKALEVYENIVTKYPASETAKTIEEYLALLKVNGRKKTGAVNAFLIRFE